MWKKGLKKNIFFPFLILLNRNTNDAQYSKFHSDSLEKWFHESENINKVGKWIWKTLNLILMLVMRILTNKQVFKAPRWYLAKNFWWKSLKKYGTMRKYFFPFFGILLRRYLLIRLKNIKIFVYLTSIIPIRNLKIVLHLKMVLYVNSNLIVIILGILLC